LEPGSLPDVFGVVCTDKAVVSWYEPKAARCVALCVNCEDDLFTWGDSIELLREEITRS